MNSNDKFMFGPKVIPMKWVIKFEPATIGLVYKYHMKDKKKHLYKIQLNNLIFLTNPEDIVSQLFYEHPQILDKKQIKLEQLTGLVRKLLDFKQRKLQEMADYLNEYEQEPDIEYEDADSDFEDGEEEHVNKSI